MECYLLEFDVLRRKAEARMITGRAFLDGSVSILRMQIAALSRTEKAILPVSVRGSSDFPTAAEQMCRLSDLRAGPARRDVLTATYWDTESDKEDLSNSARAAYRKAEKTTGRTGKTRGSGQVLIGFHKHAWQRTPPLS